MPKSNRMQSWNDIVERAKLVQKGHSRSLVEDARVFALFVLEEEQRREELVRDLAELKRLRLAEGAHDDHDEL